MQPSPDIRKVHAQRVHSTIMLACRTRMQSDKAEQQGRNRVKNTDLQVMYALLAVCPTDLSVLGATLLMMVREASMLVSVRLVACRSIPG